jgi:hypothetical protein
MIDWSTVYANVQNPTKLFLPTTPWINAADVKFLKAVWELIAAMTNISVEFGYQTADVENTPIATVAVGAARTSDGMSYGTMTDVSANTNSRRLVRFGFLVTNTASASLVLGRCGGYVEYKDC